MGRVEIVTPLLMFVLLAATLPRFRFTDLAHLLILASPGAAGEAS